MPFLSRALTVQPQGLAVDDGEVQWSYRELHRQAKDVAGRLHALGVGAGDVVAFAGQVDAYCLAALHGAWAVGSRVAPLNPVWTSREVEDALTRLAPRILLQGAPSGTEKPGAQHTGGAEAFSIGPMVGSSLPPLTSVEAAFGFSSRSNLEEGGALLLTSGTSSRAGLVSLTSGNFAASAAASARRLGLRALDRWFLSLSLAHVGGLALVSRAAFLGSPLKVRGPFKVEEFLDLAGDGSITHVSMVPTMLHRVLEDWGGRRAPSSLECVLIGGAGMPVELTERGLATDFPMALTYGLTEATSQVATAPPPLVRRKPGTVGEPLKGVQVELSPQGEILVKGPTVAAAQVAEDGWLHTGDLAREDGEGHLWITGRISNRIISGGVNVDPKEVAAVLKDFPGVREAAVVGIPDDKWGERVAAAVVCESPDALRVEDLHLLTRELLSPAKRPKEILIVQRLPRNPNGKLDRIRLRDLFQ